MVGINPTMTSHKLNVIPTPKPVRQKVRRFHHARHQIIQTEVNNLLEVDFIREVKYLEWLAKVVVVPKKGSKWRVCVDYTDLNGACPKDSFPLLCIDQIVDAATRHGILSFFDAFCGYYQISMHPPDVEKMTFITPHELYYYNVMHFGLKNVGAVATLEPGPTQLADSNQNLGCHHNTISLYQKCAEAISIWGKLINIYI